METEPGTDDDLTALAAELETENITSIDALNGEIADLVETSDHLDYDPDVDIVVHDTTVQGDEAMMSLMNAVSALDDGSQVDVIVVTRGGGADKYLRVFNETPLCQVSHRTTTPVVSAIGHENDRTLADEVGDRRVMTPTEVGQIVPRRDDLQSDLEKPSAELDQAYARTVQDRIDDLRDQLDSAYERHVDDELADLSNRLDHAYETLEQQKAHEREKAEAVESYQHTARPSKRSSPSCFPVPAYPRTPLTEPMTDDTATPTDESIAAKTDRLETSIAQLEDGEISLERAQELHAERITALRPRRRTRYRIAEAV